MGIFLETKRLVLKVPESSDLENLIALRTDPEVMKYIGTGTLQTREQVKEFLDNVQPYLEEHSFAFHSVFEKKTGNFVSQAGLFHLGFDVNQPELSLPIVYIKNIGIKDMQRNLPKHSSIGDLMYCHSQRL